MANSFGNLYILDPSPRARRLLWHLLSIGTVNLDEPDEHEAMDKPGAHLFWVQSGTGTLQVPEQAYPLTSGPRCWLVNMKKPRVYAPLPGKRMVNVGLRFGGPELEAWAEELGGRNEFALEQADFTSMKKMVQDLTRIVKRRAAGYEWEVHVRITELLGELFKAREVFTSQPLDMPKPLSRAVGLVMADPFRHWGVSELAAAAGASRSSLQLMFKHYQHESIHEFLQRTRLDHARQLLCDDRLAIKEISARLNFSSEFYFSRFFRKKTGMSPRQYRESTKV